ncbi:single-stranded-DNA-specific exonuclease RecJ [Streptococcus pyogenes ABC020056060]|uniref:single-stranded-DNA-specific exonuclease RecJ n=1 Tax=Streptococcus pyogenes TaxID=1314 RepID=UPI0004492ADC|nr:single-stranded-DNA-specific exonuclease RecJ [Streptococcus pyogenes]HEP6336553.1 single-stranded-DNA-specific exonuclease RecJ [Streptococcus pyogenes ABC020055281]HEP6357182.1 single-stranded-DNA-specific exonuclease RecJ [Streptococcus pyogenes ABC020053814]HEP6369250.1 single-stranded-DNA-specific exonuclease RecJ [Streptococcus pyogenes ABC020048603]HEP6379784.1 single-stranded-DNA-specific exonuclease RecJ [Streptococcus pyogenes ABC020039108]HEP6388231.1 single-stranded-DNA-specific
MIKSKYSWKIKDKKLDDGFFKLAKTKGLTQTAAQLIYERGIRTEEALDEFLTADLSQLHDPYLLHDVAKAVPRIRQAIEEGERILIYGDYDADGMTSASIVKETLDMMGAEPLVYLPNRFTDGYGPNQSVYKYFIEQEAVSLIITVDNGVAGHEAIRYAQEQEVDVIVTDHHSLPEELPEAFAIIHPEHPDADYPFKHLAGCGVAFKLATALLESLPTDCLDLVAIGTIADMVSLTGENRVLVKNGLAMLKHTERVGLQELMSLSPIDLEHFNEDAIGFQIAPQLNALGRLDDPNPAIELLTGFDDQEAQAIALMIKKKNEERKALVQDIFDQAMAMVDPQKPVQVLAQAGWHPGVLGIVAGRIMETIGQTVVVLTIDNGFAKGSARSLEAINIFEALNGKRELFTAFGGHAGAAGMTLPVDNLEALSDFLCQFVIERGLDQTAKNTLTIDERLSLDDLSLDILKSLDKLAPYGMDHQKPVFYVKDIRVSQARTIGQDQSHLKFKVSQGKASFDVLAFGQGSQLQEFRQATGLELAVTLSVNHWNGNTSLQFMLVDARVDGVQLLDLRTKTAKVPEGIPTIEEDPNARVILINDIPEDFKTWRNQFVHKDFDAIYFKNQMKHPYYLTGFGSREQFAKLYKTIYQFPEFDLRHKLTELSHYLNIEKLLLIKLIQIFEELSFVTIDDGLMTVNPQAQKREISESHIYQDLKELVKFQEIMALASPKEMYDYLVKSNDQ